MSRFTDKRILITGGSSGIGLATAERICAEGGTVIITGTTERHLDHAASVLPEGTVVLTNDAADPAAALELAERVGEIGPLDGAYLNAGYGDVFPVGEYDLDKMRHMFEVNVFGPALQLQALEPHLKDGGAILLTSSVAPYLGSARGPVYAATKAANLVFARSWANHFAPRGIRVNAVAPGPIETAFFDVFDGDDAAEQDKMRQAMKARVPLRRMGKPEEVAAVTTFLLSDEASYVTGAEYFADGGMVMK